MEGFKITAEGAPVEIVFDAANDDYYVVDSWYNADVTMHNLDPDDDGDALIDEDPIDGVDNDGDGSTDEDPPGGYSFLNFATGTDAYNAPGIDIWSNGADGIDDNLCPHTGDPICLGDDVCNWGRR